MQNNQKDSKSESNQTDLGPLHAFTTLLKQKEEFIESSLCPVICDTIKGLRHNNYPLKALKSKKTLPPKKKGGAPEYLDIGQICQIRHKLQHRMKKSQQAEGKQLVVVSDLLIWSIPNICSIYKGIVNYIRKWKAQANIQQRDQFCREVLKKRLQKNLPPVLEEGQQISEQTVLRVPLKLLQDIFQGFQLVNDYYKQQEKILSKCLANNQSQINEHWSTMLNLAKLEKLNIVTRIRQAQKHIEQIQRQDLDPEVYKARLITAQYLPIDPKNKYLVKYGYRLKFLLLLKKRAAKAEKRIKQRKDGIVQIIDKEKFYIDNLSEYIEYIKHPIQKLNILSEAENRNLFCNIQEIRSFHEILYNNLSVRFQQHHKYQTYGDVIKDLIPFFKLYMDYIYIAESAQNFLLKLMKENSDVAAICDKYFIEKSKQASNELMQPTFKIARYEMLFEAVIKKTNPDHKDYKFFVQANQLFRKNLTQVNARVDQIIRRNRMNQLDQEFGTEQAPIFKKDREFLNQFTCFWIKDDKLIPVIVFCFSDLILMVEEMSKKKLKYIPVNEKFYVRREEDNKVYKNMIKIHSDGFLSLTTGNEEKHFKKAEEFFDVLKTMQKTTESSQLLYVHVLGTQEIGSTSFAKHTEYIIEVKFLTLKKFLHLRFSQIANIVKTMQNHYKNDLTITEEETLKKTWFNNHKSKTIEDRKRTIEQILQKLFNHEVIRKKPEFLLQYLNLPTNFFDIARKLAFQRNSSALMTSLLNHIDKTSRVESTLGNTTNINPTLQKKDSLSRKELKQAFTILCATELKLGRDVYHDMDEDLQQKKEKAEKTEIFIYTMKDDEVQMVKVTEYDTVEDVCNKVSKLIGLRSNRDFRLFHEIGKKELRVLEHDQLILKIFKFPRSQNQLIGNFFDSMTSSIKKIVSPDTHPTLIFKKYYFLPFEIQQREVKKDLTRLRLLTYQVFAEVKDMKYQLNFDEYLLFLALLIYIENDGDIHKKKTDPEIIHRVIPETIFKLKNYTEEEWLDKTRKHLERLEEEIKKVILYNKEQMKHNRIKTDTISKTALYFGHRHLASQIVLNKIKNNKIYGSNLFYVQPYKKTYEELKNDSEKQRKMTYNMWLAIKVDSLSLLTPSSKESQFQLKYTEIDKINVYSEAIVFKTDDYTNKQYRFNTYQSFEISQLVKYYKALNEILKELGQNQTLAEQVRQYKDQILLYRSTYEAHEDTQNFKVY